VILQDLTPEPGLIRILLMADGKIAIPSHIRGIEAGEVVEVTLF